MFERRFYKNDSTCGHDSFSSFLIYASNVCLANPMDYLDPRRIDAFSVDCHNGTSEVAFVVSSFFTKLVLQFVSNNLIFFLFLFGKFVDAVRIHYDLDRVPNCAGDVEHVELPNTCAVHQSLISAERPSVTVSSAFLYVILMYNFSNFSMVSSFCCTF